MFLLCTIVASVFLVIAILHYASMLFSAMDDGSGGASVILFCMMFMAMFCLAVMAYCAHLSIAGRIQ